MVLRPFDSGEENLVGRKIGRLGTGFYASRDYAGGRSLPERRGEWKGHSVIGFADQDLERPAGALERCRHASGTRVVMRCSSQGDMLAAVRAGLGISALSCFVAESYPDLVRVAPQKLVSVADLWLLAHPDLVELSGGARRRRLRRRLRPDRSRPAARLSWSRDDTFALLDHAIIAPPQMRRRAAQGTPGFGERRHLLFRRPRLQAEPDCGCLPARRGRRPARRRRARGRTADRRRPSTVRCRAVRSACDARHRRLPRRARRGSAAARLISRARCFSVLILAADRPSRPSRSVRARRTASWSNGSNAADSRPQIAAALAVESCCPQTMWASPAKPGSRRRKAGMPAISSTGLRRGSRLISAWTASSRSDWVSRWMVIASAQLSPASWPGLTRPSTSL